MSSEKQPNDNLNNQVSTDNATFLSSVPDPNPHPHLHPHPNNQEEEKYSDTNTSNKTSNPIYPSSQNEVTRLSSSTSQVYTTTTSFIAASLEEDNITKSKLQQLQQNKTKNSSSKKRILDEISGSSSTNSSTNSSTQPQPPPSSKPLTSSFTTPTIGSQNQSVLNNDKSMMNTIQNVKVEQQSQQKRIRTENSNTNEEKVIQNPQPAPPMQQQEKEEMKVTSDDIHRNINTTQVMEQENVEIISVTGDHYDNNNTQKNLQNEQQAHTKDHEKKNTNESLSPVFNRGCLTLCGKQGEERWRKHKMTEDYIALVGKMMLPTIHLPPFNYDPSSGHYPVERITALGLLLSPLRRPSIIEKWSPYEISIFEASLALHGKEFSQIQKFVKTKSTKEIVEFYYVWKKTEHYKVWKKEYITPEMEEEFDNSDYDD